MTPEQKHLEDKLMGWTVTGVELLPTASTH
ncbi:hypothetical protein 13KS502A_gene0090 [Vibrio phage 13KS502A]|nr:hypothetical protein 13KS502A_gene0090 [Vibrio phage 13KS502A]